MTDKKWLEIVLFLLNELEEEHMGLKNYYIEIIKEKFGVELNE